MDPLSPSLFVMVMDVVARMLDKVVSEGRMSGFRVGDLEGRSLVVSHLLFANDNVILCDTNLDKILLLCMVLIWFKAMLGLKLNLCKLELVPVEEVPNTEVLVDVLGCSRVCYQ